MQRRHTGPMTLLCSGLRQVATTTGVSSRVRLQPPSERALKSPMLPPQIHLLGGAIWT
jgi:hypothetical protein